MTTETLVEQLTDEQKKRLAFISGLRGVADLYESAPDLPIGHMNEITIHLFTSDVSEFKRLKALAGATGNKFSGEYITSTRSFGFSKVAICLRCEGLLDADTLLKMVE